MIESEAIQFGVKLGYLFGVLSGFALAMLARPWGRVVLRVYRHRVRSASLGSRLPEGEGDGSFPTESRGRNA